MPIKLEQFTSNPMPQNFNGQVSEHIGTKIGAFANTEVNSGPIIKNSVTGHEPNSNYDAGQNELDFYNMGAPMQIVGLEDLAQPFKLADSAVEHTEPMPMTINEAFLGYAPYHHPHEIMENPITYSATDYPTLQQNNNI